MPDQPQRPVRQSIEKQAAGDLTQPTGQRSCWFAKVYLIASTGFPTVYFDNRSAAAAATLTNDGTGAAPGIVELPAIIVDDKVYPYRPSEIGPLCEGATDLHRITGLAKLTPEERKALDL
jgi:hypothetical protein